MVLFFGRSAFSGVSRSKRIKLEKTCYFYNTKKSPWEGSRNAKKKVKFEVFIRGTATPSMLCSSRSWQATASTVAECSSRSTMIRDHLRLKNRRTFSY